MVGTVATMRNVRVQVTSGERGQVIMGIDSDGRWATPDSSWPAADVGNGYVLPGLVDAHAHLTASHAGEMDGSHDDALAQRVALHARKQLEAGVLLVVDKGTHNLASVAMTLEIEEESRPAAQLAGRFLASAAGYFRGYATEVGPERLAAAVPDSVPPGATWVKVIGDWPRRGLGAVPSFDEATLAAAVDAAHTHGRKVAIHTAAPETPDMAVRAGVDSIEHGLFLTEDGLARLGERAGMWVPTIAAMEMLVESLGAESSGGRLIGEGLDNVRTLLPHALGAGVTVMGGTDLALAHGEVAIEAAKLAEYGMTEPEAVAAVTTAPRPALGEPAFAWGGSADFILVDAPDSVDALRRPRLVVRCGTVVRDERQ
jgi:imidazolonepropionase-like amidohydrolase